MSDNQEKKLTFYPKDIQITRQSQNKLVVEYARDLGIKLTVIELNRITDLFVEAILTPVEGDLKKRLVELDKWLAKKVSEQSTSSNVING